MKVKNIKSFIEFYKKLFEYSRYGNGILHEEYINHTNSLKESLFEGKIWGRTVEGGDDFHLFDTGASAAFLYANIDKVHEEIIDICKKEYIQDFLQKFFLMIQKKQISI